MKRVKKLIVAAVVALCASVVLVACGKSTTTSAFKPTFEGTYYGVNSHLSNVPTKLVITKDKASMYTSDNPDKGDVYSNALLNTKNKTTTDTMTMESHPYTWDSKTGVFIGYVGVPYELKFYEQGTKKGNAAKKTFDKAAKKTKANPENGY